MRQSGSVILWSGEGYGGLGGGDGAVRGGRC